MISAILLRKRGIDILLIEKKSYPFHRVCGEYISNEVKDFLNRHQIYPDKYAPTEINKLQLSSVSGKSTFLPLDLGGFGISRYSYDNFLYESASGLGVEFLLNTQVTDVKYENEVFHLTTDSAEEFQAELVLGAFGKRSKLDKALDRAFFKRRSPYIGVKYHIEYEAHPDDTIALHNFHEGYCGINKIEGEKYNLCYLSARSNLEKFRDIQEMERNILCRNPELEKIFSKAKFLFEKPEVINEISFETKQPVEQHILMCGDAAGMITPLCGNGMAMAIHSAKVLSDEVLRYFNEHKSREQLERSYTKNWNHLFKRRLWAGRQIQKLFGSDLVSNLVVEIGRKAKPVSSFLVRKTHGKPF